MRLLFYLCLSLLISCAPKKEPSRSLNLSGEDAIPEPQISFNPEHYVCYQTGVPLVIDGKMNEPAWQHAAWTNNFVDILGEARPKPRFATRVKMLWDQQYFYICAEIEEPHVWATLKKRDSIIFYDNDFEVFIDPNGDTHRYYELEINAFSTEWDLFLDKPYRDKCCAVFNWDYEGAKSAVTVHGTINQPVDEDKGWTLEIALPWSALKECADKDAPPKTGDQWRVNFSRVEWQTEVKSGKYTKVINPETGKPLAEDNWVWSPQGVVNIHYPEMWGFVQFSERIAGADQDEFKYQTEEDAKWALRQIYYRERAYHKLTGNFTRKITDLKLEKYQIQGYIWPPEIQITESLFEAILMAQDSSHKWHISQDGKTWK